MSSRILRLVQGQLRTDWQFPRPAGHRASLCHQEPGMEAGLGECRGRRTDSRRELVLRPWCHRCSCCCPAVPLSLPHTDSHTVPSTKQALPCYGVFITNVPSVLNTSSLLLVPIPLILSWTVTPSEKTARPLCQKVCHCVSFCGSDDCRIGLLCLFTVVTPMGRNCICVIHHCLPST